MTFRHTLPWLLITGFLLTHHYGSQPTSSHGITTGPKDGNLLFYLPTFSASFQETCVEIKALGHNQAWTWSAKSKSVKPVFTDGKVIYDRGRVVEQYILKEKTIEQQFILMHPAEVSADGDIVISGAIRSDGSLVKKTSGWSWQNSTGEITLGDVYSFDAVGNQIPSRMEVTGSETVITIHASDLENAVYPVTIDPEIGANDFRISFAGGVGNDGDALNYSAVSPAVAYNATTNTQLVVWVESQTGEDEIYGQLINGTTGVPLSTNDFRISTMGPGGSGSTYAATAPDVIAIGSSFFVVWSGDDNRDYGAGALANDEFEIYGQFVNGTTGALSGSMIRISTTGTDGNAAFDANTPAVTYNQTANRLMVVWYSDQVSDNQFEIYSQGLESDGTLIGGNVRVSTMGPDPNSLYDAFRPDVAWNSTSNQYLVVWHGDINLIGDNENEIFARRLDGINANHGNPIGSTIQVSDMGTTGNTSLAASDASVSYNSTNSNYLVVWFGDDDTAPLVDNENEIFGQFVTGSGTVANPNSFFRISDMGTDGSTSFAALNPDVSYDPNLGQFLVVWHGDDNTGGLIDNEFEIYGQLLRGSDGLAQGTNDFRLSDAGGTGNTTYNATFPVIAYNSGNRDYLIAWQGDDNSTTTADNENEIWGQRYADPKSEPTAQPTFSSYSTPTTSSYTVNYNAPVSVPDGYIALRKAGSAPAVADYPVDQTPYTAGTVINASSTVAFSGNALTFNESGLLPGTTYFYSIFSYNGVNASINYYTTSPLTPASVTTLSLEPLTHAATFTATQSGTNQINLTFSAASTITNAAGYIILRRQDGTNPTGTGISDAAVAPATPATGTTLITTITNTATTSFNDVSVTPGVQYNYAIIPYGYNGSNAATYNFLTAATIPTANASTLSLEPAAHAATFTATQSGTNQINLAFSAASTITNAAGYIILRRQDGTNPAATGINDGAAAPSTPATGTTLLTTITNTATTSFNDATASPGVQYNYALIPYGYNGTNAATYNFRTAATIPVANATTLSLEPLAHPATFSATQAGATQINLAFAAASTITNASGYIILRRADATNPTSAGIADAAATPATPTTGTTLVTTITNTATTSFNDTGVSPGIQYNYAIFPFGYNGSNALTYNYLLTAGLTANAFTLSAEPVAHAATFTATQSGTNQINLAFSAASTITNAAGYIILRRQDGSNPAATGINDGAAAPSTPATGTTLLTTITNTAATSFNDATASPGVQYNYALIPYGYNGTNAATYNFRTAATIPVANATTLSLEPLAHPATFSATQAGATQINLAFAAASTITNASGYIILRRQDGANPTSAGIADAATAPATPTTGTTLVTTVTNTATTSFNDTGVSPGIQYNYAIFSFGYNGSNALTYNYLLTAGLTANAFTLSAEPIAHAATFTASQSGTNQINLAFSAASTITNAAGYVILRRQDGSNPAATGINDGAAAPSTPTTGTTLLTTITNTATTSFNDATASPGVQYNYALIPYGYNGTNAATYNFRTAATIPVANATTLSLEPLAHPATFSATQAGATQINLAFAAASTITNASGYIILRRQDGANPTSAGVTDGGAVSATPVTGTTLVTTITSAGTTSYNDTGLSSGVAYNYAIIPYGYNGTNALSYNYRTAATILTASATTVVVEPTNPPTALNFSALTSSSYTLSFTSSVGGAAGYLAIRKTASSPTGTPVDGTTYTIGTPLGDGVVAYVGSATTFAEVGLASNTVYSYDIFAFNGSGVSINYLASTPLEGSRTTLEVKPANQPTALVFSNIASYSFTLSFSAPAGGSTGVIVLRTAGAYPTGVPTDGTTYTAGSSIGDGLIVSNGSTVSINETSLNSNTEYFYRAFSFNGSGPARNYLSASPLQGSQLTPPDAPVAKDPVPTATSFKAKWDPVTGATSYQVDVSTDNFATFFTGYNSKVVAASSVPEELVQGLTPLTSYKYRVRSVNAGGVSANSNEVSVLTASQGGGNKPLDIPLTNNPTFTKNFSGNSTVATVIVNDGTAPISVVLKYRTITTTSPFLTKQATLRSGSATTYEVTITKDMLDELGIEFYFEASDASGGSAKTTDPHSYMYYAVDDATGSIPFTSAFGGSSGSYEMFSIPYSLTSNQVSNVFVKLGKYDKSQWRLFHYQGGKYDENEKGINTIESGKGYWFNAANKVDINPGPGNVSESNQSKGFSITLEKGWNQIGNPYPFNVDWATVQSANSSAVLGSLWSFESGQYVKKGTLVVWRGAFVFSDNGGVVTFPVLSKTLNSGRMAQTEFSITPDETKWQLPLTLTLNGLTNISSIGMHPDASDTKDRFDEITVPRFLGYLEMSTHHKEYFAPNFTTDVVRTSNAHTWEFTIESSEQGTASLAWDRSALEASHSTFMLIDLTTSSWLDMTTADQYVFSAEATHRIKIVYSHDTSFDPGVTLIGNAYPNPFNRDLSIPVLVGGESKEVHVQVFDAMGRMVRSMQASFAESGTHTLHWDGKDDQGNEVSSGLIFYRFRNDPAQAARRLIKIR